MDDKYAVIVLYLHRKKEKYDLQVPLDITANELIVALNSAYDLGLDLESGSGIRPHLKTENPVALLQGDTLLREYRIRNGTIINFTM